MSPPTSGPPPLRRLIVPGVFVAGLIVALFLRQGPHEKVIGELAVSGPTMGTAFSVKVVTGDLTEAHRERLTRRVREVVDAVDHAMSTYHPESEIEAFNHGGTELFTASPEMIEVVVEAQRVARLTGGAFDITVGPLVEIWGFGPSPPNQAPSDAAVQELLVLTGFEQVEVDAEKGTLQKAHDGCRIDLSAIAKGYAVDRVATALGDDGYADYLVEIGGELRTRGRNGTGEAWRVGIERPDVGTRMVHTAIPLSGLSLATSGDYRNFVVRDGVRISHTIDPRTGRPIAHNLASVSVVHASCMTADALATALEVLGPDEGFAFAERQDIPALFLIRLEDGIFEERQSRPWQTLIENSAAADAVG